KERKHSI
ncbi:hypothetical protein AVEN_213591-2, partial [Araneus ventricosus]